MRYLFSFILMFAMTVSPFSVGAQTGENAQSPTGPAEKSDATSDIVGERTAKPEPHKGDPELSPFDIHRWHPEAFDPSVKSERELELAYKRATEEPSRLSRGARIAIGVVVPVVVLGVVAGAVTAARINSWEF